MIRDSAVHLTLLIALLTAGTAASGCRSAGPSTSAPPVPFPEQPPPGWNPHVTVIPTPKESSFDGSSRTVPDTLRCHLSQDQLRPLIEVMAYEFHMLTGGTVEEAASGHDASCILHLDEDLEPDSYHLDTRAAVRVSGGSYAAVAMGTVSLMQLLDGRTLAGGVIVDRPDQPYRGLLVDVAREWHDIDVLKQLILLCRWYKINHLQLHLTDDQSFTFPTSAYPLLPTPGRHYTKGELRELDAFAHRHAVGIVPEIEVPGHARKLVENMPKVFGIARSSQNPSTINMGREEAYEVLDGIIEEVAGVFRSSPYIHIGGDEASREFLDEDPDVQAYMRGHGLDSVEELYRHFLVRLDEIVRRHGRRTIVWEGFGSGGDVEIPRDVLVMAWETIYQLPQDLLASGYHIVNASWVPLYVVNEKKWDPEYIYGWNLWRWENWVPWMPSYEPIQLDPSPNVVGGSMESWAQPQRVEVWSLRKRVPAMNERIWNAAMEPVLPWRAFARMLEHTDAGFGRILSPVVVEADGLRFPDREDGHFNEPFWFGDRLTVRLRADSNLVVRYTVDGSEPSAGSNMYREPIELDRTTDLRARAYTEQSEPVGYDRWIRYELQPIEAQVEGDFVVGPDEAWKTLGMQTEFHVDVKVTLRALREGEVRYVIGDTSPKADSPVYETPLFIDSTGAVRAQLFEGNAPVGDEWIGRFKRAE